MLLLKIFRKALPPKMRERTQEMLKVPAMVDPKYASSQVLATRGSVDLKKQLREQVSRVTASTIASLRGGMPAAGARDLMRLGHSTHEPDVDMTLTDRQQEEGPNTSKLYFHGTTASPMSFLRPDPKHFATGVHGTGLYLSPDYFTALEYMNRSASDNGGHIRKYTLPSSLKLCDADSRNPLSSVSSSLTKQHIDGLKKLFVNLATFYGIDPKKKFNFSRNKTRSFSIASRHIDIDDLENHLGSLLHAFQPEDREKNQEQFTLNDVFDSKKFNPHKSMYAYCIDQRLFSIPQPIVLTRCLHDLHVTMALNMMNDSSNAHHDVFIRDKHGNLETKDQLTFKKDQMMKIIRSLPHEEMASHMLAAMGYDGLRVTPASEKSNIVIFPHAVHKLRFEGSARSIQDERDARDRR